MEKGVQKCMASGCESTTDIPDLGFFDFPNEDREQIRAWNKALGFRANCKHVPEPKVCEKHFTAEQMDKSSYPVHLVPGAVPCVVLLETKPDTDDVAASGSALGEASYCRLCAKMERQPFKNNIDKMVKCHETAKLLKICLETADGNQMLPNGVCDACSHMMKFFIKFVKTCCGAQEKLTKIFVKRNADIKELAADTSPQSPAIKREFDESIVERPVEHLQSNVDNDKTNNPRIETNEEPYVIDDCGDVAIKTEPNRIDSDSDFEMPKDCPASSQSESESGSSDDDYDPDEDPSKRPIKSEDDAQTDEKPQKRRGRPRKNEPRLPRGARGSRKPREKRDKNEDKPASLCKQICQICGKILSSSATFNVHMMTHTQQKDIVCPICDRRFYVKQQLKIHIESIHEKKDFVCNICGLKCRWRKSLRRHMLLHDENPYKHKCTYCDKAFARPNQLRYHVMKHTGDRVYCDICGADYRFNYMLTQHKIRKHGIVIEGVQLYKQSSRKKKSETGDPSQRKNRFPTNQSSAENELSDQSAGLVQIPPAEHDRTTNQSDLTHVADLGSPATNASFSTIASPEPTHFVNHAVIQQSHTAAVLQQQPSHHQQQNAQISGFNGAGLNISMPSGLIGFPPMTRQ